MRVLLAILLSVGTAAAIGTGDTGNIKVNFNPNYCGLILGSRTVSHGDCVAEVKSTSCFPDSENGQCVCATEVLNTNGLCDDDILDTEDGWDPCPGCGSW